MEAYGLLGIWTFRGFGRIETGIQALPERSQKVSRSEHRDALTQSHGVSRLIHIPDCEKVMCSTL